MKAGLKDNLKDIKRFSVAIIKYYNQELKYLKWIKRKSFGEGNTNLLMVVINVAGINGNKFS